MTGPAGHPALVDVVAVLREHDFDSLRAGRFCVCGWGQPGPGRSHFEHVAVQLAIAGVLKAPS